MEDTRQPDPHPLTLGKKYKSLKVFSKEQV